MANFIIGDLISRIKVASKGHLKQINVLNTKISIDILDIFYKTGLIRGFKINLGYIEVYLKYYQNKPIFFDIELISVPSKKVYWSLEKLSFKYNLNSFAGFYIVSTSKGLITSTECLLGEKISGKVILKIFI